MSTRQWEQDHPPMPEEVRNEFLEHRKKLAIMSNMLDHNLEKEEPIVDPIAYADLIRQMVSDKAQSGLRTTIYVFDRTTEIVTRLDEMQMVCSREKAFPAQEVIEQLRQRLEDIVFPLHGNVNASQISVIALELREMTSGIVDLIEEDLQQAFGSGHQTSL